MESTQIRKKRSCKGYTLVELMAVIAIRAALAAVSAGIYSGYVERAREAELYETAEQIKNALLQNTDASEPPASPYLSLIHI